MCSGMHTPTCPCQVSRLSFWLVLVPSHLNCYRSPKCWGKSPADSQQGNGAFSLTAAKKLESVNYLNDLWISGVRNPECETLDTEPSIAVPQLLAYKKQVLFREITFDHVLCSNRKLIWIGLKFYNHSQDSMPKSKASFSQFTYFQRFQENPNDPHPRGISESEHFGSPSTEGG